MKVYKIATHETPGFEADPWCAFFVPKNKDAEEHLSELGPDAMDDGTISYGDTESEAVANLFKNQTQAKHVGLFEGIK